MCIALVSQLSCWIGNFSFKKKWGEKRKPAAGWARVTVGSQKIEMLRGHLDETLDRWSSSEWWDSPGSACLIYNVSRCFNCHTQSESSVSPYLKTWHKYTSEKGQLLTCYLGQWKPLHIPQLKWCEMLSNQLGRQLGPCGWACLHPWMWLQPNPGSSGNLNIRLLNFCFELWILCWRLNSECLKILAEVHIWMNSLHVLKESHEFFVNNLLVA